MPGAKWILVPVFAVAGIVIVLLVLWGICILCSNLHYPPNDTTKPPNYYYNYNLSGNGTIDRVLIIAEFSPIMVNDVRYLDSDGGDIEVKIWGRAVNANDIYFRKEGGELTAIIRVSNAVDFGMYPANEHIYLPKNWTYTIVSTNGRGNTTVENKSWSYNSYGKT